MVSPTIERCPHDRGSPSENHSIFLVKPSKYDDDGFVVRHWRGVLPSNTLACLHGLIEEADSRASARARVPRTIRPSLYRVQGVFPFAAVHPSLGGRSSPWRSRGEAFEAQEAFLGRRSHCVS
jgi:hypothetical protein